MSEASVVMKAIRNPKKAVSVVLHNLLAPVGHRNYKRFIVLTRDRTGSNMLIQMLNSHPNISADYEIFGKLHGNTEQNILNRSFSKQPFYIKVKGFKIFYYHPQDAAESTIWDILESTNGLYVIHLKRKNILRTLVSSRVAYSTGVYGVRSKKEESEFKKKVAPIVYTESNMKEDFEQTRSWEQEGEVRFKNHPLISINYEDMVSKPDQTFRTVTDFLGVDYRKPRTDFKKQSSKSMRNALTNYGELKAAFSATEWQVFFDE